MDQRPQLVALAGPNGAGKTTFFEAYLKPVGLRFLNADELARELETDAYFAATLIERVREELVARRESFVFETVLSDPVGAKVEFLQKAAQNGYEVTLIFIGLGSPAVSEDRVAMRVSQGGHDVPREKIAARYERTLRNLKRAIAGLPTVYIYDNSNLENPFRLVAVSREGKIDNIEKPSPRWLKKALN